MPILERIAGMRPDAMETFTPTDMGGDMRLAEAKRRIGDKVCMIGGFDQFHFFMNCTPERRGPRCGAASRKPGRAAVISSARPTTSSTPTCVCWRHSREKPWPASTDPPRAVGKA